MKVLFERYVPIDDKINIEMLTNINMAKVVPREDPITIPSRKEILFVGLSS